MPHFTSGDAEIFYQVDGQGPPLLLISGMGGTAAWWRHQLDAFAARFQVIRHDQRGTGASSRLPVASIDHLASDMVALMDHLGIERADIVGHSTGGAIGQVLALDHPARVARLVIAHSVTHADAYRRRVWGLRRALLEQLGPEAYARATTLFLYPNWWIRDNAARLDEEEAAMAANLPPADVMASRIGAMAAFDRTGELGRVRAPTLVICAEDDIQTPPYFSRDLADLIPDARLVVAPRGGHAAPRVTPDVFNRHVLDFLEAGSES